MVATLAVRRLAGEAEPGEANYQPRGAALSLFYSRAPEVLIEGPSGTGKSRACLQKLDLCMLRYPGARAAIVRKTRESLTQTVLVTYERKVLPETTSVVYHHEDQEYRYPNGSRIIVGGMDKESKVMSSEYDLIYVPEATELAESEAETLTTRLRNGVLPYQQLLMDCNPDGPQHWLNLRCNRGQTVRLHSRHEDNPSVTPEYLATLDALTGFRHQRLRLGLWVAAEGQFFTEWNPLYHVCPAFNPPADWTRWLAVDYGFADPCCVLWFARDPTTKRIYVYRELYASGLRDEQQADLILARSTIGGVRERIVRHVGDPSMFNERREQNKQSIATVYQQHGVPLQPAQNARVAGWQTVRRALAGDPPRLQVMDARCLNLIRTLPTMVVDPLDAEDLADKLKGKKTEDHAADCLRYGLVAESGFHTLASLPIQGHVPQSREALIRARHQAARGAA